MNCTREALPPVRPACLGPGGHWSCGRPPLGALAHPPILRAPRRLFRPSDSSRLRSARVTGALGFFAYTVGILVGPGRLQLALIWSALILLISPLASPAIVGSNKAGEKGSIQARVVAASRLELGLASVGFLLLLFELAVAATDLVVRMQSGSDASTSLAGYLPVSLLVLASGAAAATLYGETRHRSGLIRPLAVLLPLGVFLILFLPDIHLPTGGFYGFIGMAVRVIHYLTLVVYLVAGLLLAREITR
jgi:hypothetical protein